MSQTTPRAVSIRADENYIIALRKVSQKRGQPMADVVRDALDAQLGTELQPWLDSLADGERKSGQMDQNQVEATSDVAV